MAAHAGHAALSWRATALELLRAGPGGNAMRLEATEAYRLLTQWKDTRRQGLMGAVAAGLVVMLVCVSLVLLFTGAAAAGGPVGFALGAAGLVVAVGCAIQRVWRIPFAMVLVRYGVVAP